MAAPGPGSPRPLPRASGEGGAPASRLECAAAVSCEARSLAVLPRAWHFHAFAALVFLVFESVCSAHSNERLCGRRLVRAVDQICPLFPPTESGFENGLPGRRRPNSLLCAELDSSSYWW